MDELLQELNEINAAAQVRMDYAKTLALLRALKSGRVSLDSVTLIEGGWSVAAVAPSAAESPADPAIAPAE